MVHLPLSVAPMIDWTHTHFRVLMRLLAPHALLYTEMQTPQAITHHPQRCLYFSPIEHPIALQLGGSDPTTLLTTAQRAQDLGYDEVNLNLGCPSDRVLAGQFGACLMKEPEQVAHIIRQLKQHIQIPITAKTRIGVDHQDDYDFFSDFIHRLADAGCDKFIIHARKAWLHGLSPKQNRTIPPIQYEYAYQIKSELPHLPFVINGNINTIDAIRLHLKKLDGVMLGRLACDNPYAIAKIHHALYPDSPLPSRNQIARDYFAYLRTIPNTPLSVLLKPILNLSHGLPNGKVWKNHLIQAQHNNATPEQLEPIFESVFDQPEYITKIN